MLHEPIIVKEAFHAIGVSVTTTNEKRHLLKETFHNFGTDTFKNK